ncbi:MAG: nicotinate-nucleotide adenylyltransferase [Acidimicrobiia bacterium]
MIGILGGTFDPPHVGHLSVANAAIEQLGLDEVRFVPAGDPWQKADEYVTEARHRLAMTRLAAAEDPRFVVDDIEIRRDGPSYMIDTVETYAEPCVLILGTDAAAGIPTWHRGSELLRKVEIAVVGRPGVAPEDVEKALERPVLRLDMPSVEVSGTAIRTHVASGFSPRFLVPGPVCDYIDSNELYR